MKDHPASDSHRPTRGPIRDSVAQELLAGLSRPARRPPTPGKALRSSRALPPCTLFTSPPLSFLSLPLSFSSPPLSFLSPLLPFILLAPSPPGREAAGLPPPARSAQGPAGPAGSRPPSPAGRRALQPAPVGEPSSAGTSAGLETRIDSQDPGRRLWGFLGGLLALPPRLGNGRGGSGGSDQGRRGGRCT
jgi:hypothetical protein